MELTKTNICRMLNKYPNLTAGGFSATKNPLLQDPSPPTSRGFSFEKVALIAKVIPSMYKEVSKFEGWSYGMKHDVENALGGLVARYVSNGELILAMLCMGYDPKIDGPNCYFKVKTRFPNFNFYDADNYDYLTKAEAVDLLYLRDIIQNLGVSSNPTQS